ncbi:hypothetical protein CEUSTIGMA_g8183.t1 [Chlamydomonas eustigma]|uniref:Right handed beta helix domain-containing protein n=1 Tax=Chlamydomonas eustigma TaxID=1157962 RepID=A0A250XCD8_9CHLO|nr:hypothetical protein CEUSTIGMA_g8183.t1 [Chlamydomonas eustigma]|eukprot:GAX80748.1 hypothetical protein CEUSTIGMA_g8183.t1 [Chlamydomonas eustigma]
MLVIILKSREHFSCCLIQIYASSALYAAITNSNISHNIAVGSGGGVFVASGQQLSIKGVDGSVNSANQLGGAVSVSNTQNVILEDINTSRSTATQSGGAVSATFVTNLTIDQLTSNNCYTTGSGGAIYTSTALYTTINNSSLSNNIAIGSGGAVFVSSGQQLLIKGVDGSVSSASQSGGAVSVSNTQNVILENMNISSSTATQSGGAVSATFITNLTIDQLTSNNCYTTGSGGAIYMSSALHTAITNSNLSNNIAIGSGGAVYTSNANTLDIYAANISYNSASSQGGAICVYNLSSYLSLSHTSVEYNSAKDSGGAVYTSNSNQLQLSNLNLTRNSATGSGGAVFGSNTLLMNVSGGVNISGNTALGSGGGVYSLVGGSLLLSNNVNLTSNNAGGSGGAIYASNLTDTLNLTGLNIVSNSASESGGGLYASGVQTLQVVNSSLTNSSSSLAGGCIWANVTGCTLLSNSSFSTCTSSLSSGGAGFLYLPPQQLSSNYQNFSVNRSGCPVDLLQNLYPALSDSAQALLLPTQLSSVPASIPTSTPSGKRRLEGTSQPSEFSSYIPSNNDSYILPTLLISSVNVSLASAGTSGGALYLQLSPGSTALIDQLNAGSNNAISNDGGAMAVAMSVSALNSASLGNESAPQALINITNSNLTSNLAINGYGGALALSSGPTDTTMQVENGYGGALALSSGPTDTTMQVENGYGGALALSSGPTDTTMQVSLFNSFVASNVATRGGGISIQGSGLSLSLQNSTVLYNNTARIPKSSIPAVFTSTQTSSGGCIYARGCLSVLVSGGSRLSSCTAQPSSSITQPSYGGAISINSCSALAVHNCSITNSSADSGGAVHASTTTLLLLKDSTISNCTATGVLPALSAINATVQSSVYGTIDSFSGLGGAAQISGQSAALLQRCAFEGNSAGSFGGALSVTTNCSAKAQALLKNASQHNMSIPTLAYLPTFLTPYLDVLSPLAARASAGCFSTTLQQCSVRNNSAQVSGGGIFSSSSTGLSLTGLGFSDLSFSLQSPIDQASPAVMTAYHPLTNLSSQLVGSSCNMLGNKCFLGQGMNVGTMPASVAFTGQATQVNSAAGSTGNASAPSIPLVRFTASGSLVIPSTSPMTEINLPLYLLDALGENVTDPWLLSGISMSVGSNVEDTNILLILGTTFATYNVSTSTFVFSGLSLRAVVGETYRFFFYVDSTLSGGDVIQPLSVSVVVPDCSDGEFYVFNKTACYQCRGGTFALSSAANQPADFCLPCPVGAECSGGAVVVPTSSIWHSAAASTEMHNCLNPVACKRTFQQVTQLQNCQTAWYSYLLANTTLTPTEASEAAQYLISAYNCTLLDALNINNPFAYLNLLCADGYGGNLCAVCVTNSLGQVTGSSGSNYLCGVCSSKLQVLGANIGFFLVNLAMIIIQVLGALGEQTVVGQLQFTDISGLLISHLQYLVVVLKLGLQWPTSVTVLTTTASSITSVANEAFKVNALSCLSNDSSPEAQATYSMAGGLIIPAALIVTPLLVWLGLWLVRRHYLYPLIEAGSKKCMFCIGLPAVEEKDGGGDDDKPEVKEAENARSASSWRANKGADSHNSEVQLTPPEVKTGDQDSCESKQKSVADFLGGPDHDSAHIYSYRAGPVAESQAFEEDSAEPRDVVAESQAFEEDSAEPRDVVAEQGAAQHEDRTSSDSCKVSQGRRPKTMPGFSTQPSSQVFLSTLGAGLKLPPATSRAFLLPPIVHAAQEIEVAAVAAEAAASVQRSLLIRPRSEDGGVRSSVRSVGDVSLRSLQSFGSVGRSSYNVATAGDSGSALRNAVGGDLGAAFSSGKGAGQVWGDYADGHCLSMEGGSSALTSSLEGGDQVKRKDVESIKAKGKAGWDLLRHAALQAIEEDLPVCQDGKDGNPSADLERYPAVQSRSKSAAAVRQAVRVAASAFTRAALLRRLKLPEPIISKVVPRWFVPSDAPSTEPEEETKEGEKSGMLKALVDKLQLLDEYMPLHQQLLAVLINACFVVYQGWASSALSVFACQLIDTGVMDPSTPSYYAQFQQAAAPHGYWLLNMNQACYQGTHLSKWTPVGAVTSIIISIGIPTLTALPIYLNRNNLDSAEAQHQYGWLYMKYDYKHVPYWASVAQLELLLLVLVQVFSSSFSSVIQQAAVLQVTLLVIVLINTAVWPTVHPLLVLLSFISFAVLITTIALGILIGDGTVTVGNGTISILGTLIIFINVTFIGMLVVISYRHARSAIEKALFAAKAKTSVFFKTGINTSRLLFKSASDSLRRTMSLERRLTPAQDSSLSRTLHGGGNNSSSLRSSGRWSMRSILLRSSFRSSQVAAETVLADAATTV